MFSLEMCHLLNYSFCFYSAIEPTFVLELRASYTVFVLFTPGGEILYPQIPRAESCDGVASLFQTRQHPSAPLPPATTTSQVGFVSVAQKILFSKLCIIFPYEM